MPYKDKGKQREATKEATRRYRGKVTLGITKGKDVIPEDVLPDVTPPDPWDERRKNYSEAYLRCLKEQGGVLTEKSAPMVVGVTMKKGFLVRYEVKEEVRKPIDREKLEKVRGVLR